MWQTVVELHPFRLSQQGCGTGKGKAVLARSEVEAAGCMEHVGSQVGVAQISQAGRRHAAA